MIFLLLGVCKVGLNYDDGCFGLLATSCRDNPFNSIPILGTSYNERQGVDLPSCEWTPSSLHGEWNCPDSCLSGLTYICFDILAIVMVTVECVLVTFNIMVVVTEVKLVISMVTVISIGLAMIEFFLIACGVCDSFMAVGGSWLDVVDSVGCLDLKNQGIYACLVNEVKALPSFIYNYYFGTYIVHIAYFIQIHYFLNWTWDQGFSYGCVKVRVVTTTLSIWGVLLYFP
eukprot:Gb_14373 [translate_table: standard]